MIPCVHGHVVCAHVCVCSPLKGSPQAKLCRVYHDNFLMTASDTGPNENPLHTDTPEKLHCVSTQPSCFLCLYKGVCVCVYV